MDIRTIAGTLVLTSIMAVTPRELSAGEPGFNRNTTGRDIKKLGDKLNRFTIGFSFYRWRGYPQLQYTSFTTENLIPRGPGLYTDTQQTRLISNHSEKSCVKKFLFPVSLDKAAHPGESLLNIC